MKSKVILKIALILLIVSLIVTTFSTLMFSYADDANFELSGFEGKTNDSINNPTTNIAGAILGAVRVFGLGVAIIMLAVVAMKYMIAAPGERADLKKSSIQYAVGAIIVFGATNIITTLIEFWQTALPED